MTQGIFVSYRRDDTRHVAGRLAGDLAAHFGHDQIFRDVESIEGGDEFPAMLEKAIEKCALMLVLIGPQWLAAADSQGRRRLDDPADWVRQEISVALRHGVRVVPVLVESAPLPAGGDLPDELKPLVSRQARPLSDERWRGDLAMLIEVTSKVTGLKPQEPALEHAAAPVPAAPPKSRGWVKWAAGAGLALVVLAVVGGMGGGGGTPTGEAAATPADAGHAAAPSDLPDLSGTWRSDSTYHYTLKQDGREVAIKTSIDGVEAGAGSGRLEGDTLHLVFTTRGKNGEVLTENCELSATDGYKRFEGQCAPVGGRPYPYYIRR